MSEIPPKCKICQGGCCEGDINLYGLMQKDLKNLALFNIVKSYLPDAFTDLHSMYLYLKSTSAVDGYYTLQNDVYGKDINGIRLGKCNANVDGVCLLENEKPHPCKMMDYEGPACMRIFTKKMSEVSLGL